MPTFRQPGYLSGIIHIPRIETRGFASRPHERFAFDTSALASLYRSTGQGFSCNRLDMCSTQTRSTPRTFVMMCQVGSPRSCTGPGLCADRQHRRTGREEGPDDAGGHRQAHGASIGPGGESALHSWWSSSTQQSREDHPRGPATAVLELLCIDADVSGIYAMVREPSSPAPEPREGRPPPSPPDLPTGRPGASRSLDSRVDQAAGRPPGRRRVTPARRESAPAKAPPVARPPDRRSPARRR
jgi:hypothetical protein